jgi:type I restriction enzyme S subunit
MHPIAAGRAADVQSLKYAFQKDDVLYGKLRPYLDKAVLATNDGVCTTELLVLRPRARVDPRYLSCVVHAPEFIDFAMSGVTGAHHPRTSWNHIAQFKIPAMDRSEQSAVATLLWGIHDLLANCGMTTENAQELKQAAMRELFTRGLRGEDQKETEIGPVPESWEILRLSDVAALERGRFMHRPRNEPRFYGGNTPFVQTGDIVRSGGRIKAFTQTLNDDGVAISKVFPSGTILITIAANIGYTGILEFDSACPDSLVAITPDSRANKKYLNYYLQTQQEKMDREAPKGTQKNINIQFLRPWHIKLPKMDEQRDIASILDAIDRKIDLHKRKRAVLEELFQAMLHKIMTGEIRAADLDLSVLDAANA